MLQQEKCPDCGTVPGEWLEIDEEGRAIPQEPPPYKVEQQRCEGCIAKDDAESMVPSRSRKGIHFFFRRWHEDDEL